LKVLGPPGNSGKAEPVLVTMKCSSEAKHLIRHAYRFRQISVTADLSTDSRDERREATEKLKKKIKDFSQ
jgi:hypothetical protein